MPALMLLAALAAAPPVEHRLDVRFVGTPSEVLTRMLDVAGLTPADTLYDLGCGDGRIVLAAARRFGCQAVGFDLDPARLRECAAAWAAESPAVQRRVSFVRADLFTVDLRPATVVMLYLRPELNVKLLPQLRRLGAGARVVSHNWDLKGVRPDAGYPVTVRKQDGFERLVYRWTAPLVVTAD